MKIQQNIGIVNSLLRIICGFTLLSWSIAKMSRRPWKQSYLIISMLAGMKIGEGILHYCPVVELMNKYQSEPEKEVNEEDVVINPT